MSFQCLNKNLPDYNKFVKDFSEQDVAKLADEVFGGELPSYSEFIKNKVVKEQLGILTQTQANKELGLSLRKEISNDQQIKLKQAVNKKNNQNKANGIKEIYRTLNISQSAQSTSYTWGVRKFEGDLDVKAKVQRAKDRIVDPSQVYTEPRIQEGGQMNMFQNNQSNVQYQLPQDREIEEFVASEKTIRDLAARMSDRIGIPVRFESDRIKEYKGKLENGTAVVNLAYATLDTPIHEILAHPIIRAIKNRTNYYKTGETAEFHGYGDSYRVTIEKIYDDTLEADVIDEQGNKQKVDLFELNKTQNILLYQSLLKELETGRGKEVLDRVKKDYVNKYDRSKFEVFELGGKFVVHYDGNNLSINNKFDTLLKSDTEFFNTKEEADNKVKEYTDKKYTIEEQQEEAIVELLGLMTAEKLDKVKDGKLISLLKRLLKEMKSFIRNLINQKEVEIDKLPDNMTLGDIADLLAYSNSKLILPGNEVIYTTPDNQQFKTYQEASNHISELARNVEDVDLDNVDLITDSKIAESKELENEYFELFDSLYKSNNLREKESEIYLDLKNNNTRFYGNAKDYDSLKFAVTETGNYYQLHPEDNSASKITKDRFDRYINQVGNTLGSFIEKNKEYEQSKEIIEEWKKVNNIQYNPEEVYSRGQEFVSVVGAYSDFDVNLMMQNLLQHIEDNQKADGEFTISAFTKPVDKRIGHLEGGGGKIKFKIYPQSQNVKWAANTDVYSGSVWDASEKVSKDKKSELLGVSYTKYPSLSNVNTVQPNLAAIIDDLAHHHNELGISLTGSNFRLEYDNDIPYSTKKIINSINSILDQKYGKLVEPEINKNNEKIKKYSLEVDAVKQGYFDTKEEAERLGKLAEQTGVDYLVKEVYVQQGTQPTQTNETLEESIESVKNKLQIAETGSTRSLEAQIKYKKQEIAILDGILNTSKDSTRLEKSQQKKEQLLKDIEILQNKIDNPNLQKEYTSQALINTKIAKLKEVAKKYPRSLIRSEVRRIRDAQNNYGFDETELPFQKIKLAENSFIVNALNTKYQRELGINFDEFYDETPVSETVDVSKYQEQINRLKKAINVDVIFESGLVDNDGLPVRGMVRTENGKPVVVLNPEFLKDDTVSHEFAHIFIDILGGLNNPRIKAAVEKLKGTDLWNQVAEIYPELNSIDLAKEVLAEAMGKTGAEIFDGKFETSWWDRFLDWFFNMVGIKTNTSADIIKELTQEMFESENLLPAYMGIPVFQKINMNESKQVINNINDVYKKQLESLNAKIRIWKGKVKEEGEDSAYINKLKGIKEDIQEYLDAENKKGIINILTYTVSQYESITRSINNDEHQSDMLQLIDSYRSSFDIVKDINKLRTTNSKEFEIFSEEEMTQIESLIGKVLTLEDTFNNKLDDYSLKLLSRKYAGHSTRILRTYKIRKQQEFLKNNNRSDYNSKQEFNDAMKKYVDDFIDKNKERIEKEEYEWFYNQLKTGYDITEFHGILDSGQVNSTIIQIVQKILEKQDMITTGTYMSTRADLVELHKKFGKSGMNQAELYKDIIDITDDGTYLVDKYKPEFYETRTALVNESNKAFQEFGKGSKELDAANEALNKFDKENIKHQLPIEKWKNPKWTNMSATNKEVVAGLKKIIDKADGGTNGLMRFEQLRVVTKKIAFYKLPFVEKSLAQRVAENNFQDTISRTIGDITKKRSTEEDADAFNESVDDVEATSEHIKNVYTDEDNKVINRIPVHFRKHIDKKNRSYDVFSLVLMNTFTSENYKNKHLVSADLELIKGLVSKKEHDQTSGLKVMISKLFNRKVPKENKGGNEHKMLTSILEHRLYGLGEIQRMDGKANKVAGFINGWASSVMLGLNYFSMVPNYMMGTTMNIAEAAGGMVYSMSDYKKAHLLYWGDIKGITSDIGKVAPTSKTNLLMDYFEVLGDSSIMGTKFIDRESARKFVKRDTLFATSHVVEHQVQALMMYSVLENMGLTDKIEVKDGKLKFNISQNELLDARRKIKKVIADAHGQYDSRMKSAFQREFYGSSLFMFRKWIVRGTTRRWRGIANLKYDYMDENLPDNRIFYSEESGQFEEGTYVTALRFFKNLFKDYKSHNGNIIRSFNQITPYERANIIKTGVDFVAITMMYAAYVALSNMASDEDDEDTKNMYYLSAYWFRRSMGEVSFWLNPMDAINIIRTPAASLNFFEQVGDAAYELLPGFGWNQFERNSGHYKKGDYKVFKKLEKITPLYGQIRRYDSAQDALSYLTK